MRASAALVRNPNLIVFWQNGRLSIRQPERSRLFQANAAAVLLLEVFNEPKMVEDVVRELGPAGPDLVPVLKSLRRNGLLLSAEEARGHESRIEAWKGHVASVLYHVSTRDLPYLSSPRGMTRYLEGLSKKPRPPLSKSYPEESGESLTEMPRSSTTMPLSEALRARRTNRRFSRKSVSLADFSAVMRETWGQSGWICGTPLGRLIAKSSPSAGAMHPIECYVLAWNVAGLKPGLYHFDMQRNRLRLLRAGNLRRAAVRAASEQSWVGNAAFLCIMTAAFERTLFRYHGENAFRIVWLDAGHLAQTFCLVATARGLGPFTTAAIQESYIEELLGIDGIREFPVYLCGAGRPAR